MSEWAKKAPALVAIIALTVVGSQALRLGVDGVMLAAVVTGIAGLGGFYLQDLLGRRG